MSHAVPPERSDDQQQHAHAAVPTPSFDDVLATFQRARDAHEHADIRRERLQLLQRTLEPLQPFATKYWDYYFFIEPSGRDGRPLQEEFDAFLAARKKDLNAVPTFTYPNLEKLEIGGDADYLATLRTQYGAIEDPHVRAIALRAHDAVRLKLELFQAMRDRDDARVMEIQHALFGGVRPETLAAAHAAGAARANAGPKEATAPIITALEHNTYGAEEIRVYFARACQLLGLDAFRVIISPSVSAITVKLHPEGGGQPQVMIPPKRELNGVQLLRLIAHEIGTHAVTNQNAINLGLPLDLGPEYELFQEGMAKHAERQVQRTLSGTQRDTPDDDLLPYNILALERVQQGGNFREVFEHMLTVRGEAWLRKNGKKRTPPPTLEEAREQPSVVKATLVQCRRLFRGFHDLSVGGRAFFKDKMYFEGALLADEMDRAGVADVLLQAKIDPWIAEHLVAAGVTDRPLGPLVHHLATMMLREHERDLTRPRWERAYEEFMDFRTPDDARA